ncbi:MAG: hypothetical protein Kow0075_15080 [Salibacteraceae bacterium]
MILASAALILSACKKTEAPEADFSYTAEGLEVTFQFTGSGEVETYDWDFGDGASSSQASPKHTYAASGSYQVTLVVSNEGGSDEVTKTVDVSEPVNAAAPEMKFGDADGAFYAINSNTVTHSGGFTVVVKAGSAVAWFTDGSGFVTVGDVAWEQGSKSEKLEQNDNNTYLWVESEYPTNGFSNDGVGWTITGGNGFNAIPSPGIVNNNPFPSTQEVDESSDNINGNTSYTLTHKGAITDADSTFFSVFGPDDFVMKRVGPGVTSVTFSAAEMQSVGKGFGILQIASFNFASDESTGKKLYLVNESVASKTVNIE